MWYAFSDELLESLVTATKRSEGSIAATFPAPRTSASMTVSAPVPQPTSSARWPAGRRSPGPFPVRARHRNGRRVGRRRLPQHQRRGTAELEPCSSNPTSIHPPTASRDRARPPSAVRRASGSERGESRRGAYRN